MFRFLLSNTFLNLLENLVRFVSFTMFSRCVIERMVFTFTQAASHLKIWFLIHSHVSWPWSGDCGGSRIRTRNCCVTAWGDIFRSQHAVFVKSPFCSCCWGVDSEWNVEKNSFVPVQIIFRQKQKLFFQCFIHNSPPIYHLQAACRGFHENGMLRSKDVASGSQWS
jgi:hypothetical protein